MYIYKQLEGEFIMKKIVLLLLFLSIITMASMYTNTGSRRIHIQAENVRIDPGDTVELDRYYDISNLTLVSYEGGLNWLVSSDTATIAAGAIDTFTIDYNTARYISIIPSGQINIWINDTTNAPALITSNGYNIGCIRSVARIIVRAVVNVTVEINTFRDLEYLEDINNIR